MGASVSILETYSQRLGGGKELLQSECEDEFSSVASENFLRLTILENIRLEFQRPTIVLLYGCPHSCVNYVSKFLSKKLGYEIIECGIDQPLDYESQHQSNISSSSSSSPYYGQLYQNYPQTFEQVLSLQSTTKGSQIVVIFLNCSYAVSFLYFFFLLFI